jgi:hypothetical protein
LRSRGAHGPYAVARASLDEAYIHCIIVVCGLKYPASREYDNGSKILT